MPAPTLKAQSLVPVVASSAKASPNTSPLKNQVSAGRKQRGHVHVARVVAPFAFARQRIKGVDVAISGFVGRRFEFHAAAEKGWPSTMSIFCGVIELQISQPMLYQNLVRGL
jgi:hypothetical protein